VTWSDEARVTEYLGREIPHRATAEALLLESLPERVERVLDLGTGDGRLLALVLERHPQARAVAVDVSEPMIERARRRFAGRPVDVRRHDLAEALPELGAFDVVVSGLAIHHLEDPRKRALLGEVVSVLRPGGAFCNLDLASAPDADGHERFREAIGCLQDDPEDRLAPLAAQLAWLAEAGFERVDCAFKWRELALMTCRRPDV
jgi:SAM-dependent methyltransferase